MKFLSKMLQKPNRKYVITLLIFLILYLFIDQNNLFRQIKLSRELRKKQEEEQYYTRKIIEQRKLFEGISHDTSLIEKIAREKYLMKKDNEVIYIIETQTEPTKTDHFIPE